MAGKTTELMRYLERAIRGKKRVCLFRPRTDSREFFSHSVATEITFNNLNIPIISINEDGTFHEGYTVDSILKTYDVIGIDECQFIHNLKFIVNTFETKDIYMSGLLATSECTVFPSIVDVLPYCDEIIKLNAVCSVCGNDLGNYTYHKGGAKTAEVEVGGASKYDARCKHCYHLKE